MQKWNKSSCFRLKKEEGKKKICNIQKKKKGTTKKRNFIERKKKKINVIISIFPMAQFTSFIIYRK